MQTLILKTDDLVFEQIKSFLSLIPKEKVEIIDPFAIDYVCDEEQEEILKLLKNIETKEIVASSKKTYEI